jgi:DNA repair exonuclease SbcCD ATPase subunit
MKIQINKFKSLENLTFSIPCQIGGGNGLGKSTILESISFVLTGKNLDGKEFEQVYDNRVDIHDAIADVSYFDNYGNEWSRTVQPVFKTNRAGVEYLDTKCSTTCRKNTIVCNDYSDEFQDFYKFGTDYFFNQKEDIQRSIFIDILKSKLPNYDVNAASLKLKELKKSQKIEVNFVKDLQNANKNTKDVEVPTIPADVRQQNDEYLALSSVDNSEAVVEINRKNNEAQAVYLKNKSELAQSISDTEIQISKAKSSIGTETEALESVKKSVFVPKTTEFTKVTEFEINELTKILLGLAYFESIEKYAEKYFNNNPVLVENATKISEILAEQFVYTPNSESGNCPISGKHCGTAERSSEVSAKYKFDTDVNLKVYELKRENREILEKEMAAVNREYNAVKSDLQEAERKLNRVIEANRLVESDNAHLKADFDSQNEKAIQICTDKIIAYSAILKENLEILSEKQTELSALTEPTPEKLPESVEISEELKVAHSEFEAINEQIIGAKAINANNAKLIESRTEEIKLKQANLLQIIEKITTLTTEISDYFSNLAAIVKQEFSGEIELDVQLLEYVMSKDEYKDCFKITANGKVFPYECNGALQNNVKMQVLANLQRLKGYTGVTVMDNCEANTTQVINTCGLNCVLAYATLENELIIK